MPSGTDSYDPDYDDPIRPSRRGRLITGAIAMAALTAFAGMLWYAYNLGIKAGTESVAPLIRADGRPTKIRPEQPGGMEVPHQDKYVYDRLAQGETQTSVERLLPPPEDPLPRPENVGVASSAAAEETGESQIPKAPAPSDLVKLLEEQEASASEAEPSVEPTEGSDAEDAGAPQTQIVPTVTPPPPQPPEESQKAEQITPSPEEGAVSAEPGGSLASSTAPSSQPSVAPEKRPEDAPKAEDAPETVDTPETEEVATVSPSPPTPPSSSEPPAAESTASPAPPSVPAGIRIQLAALRSADRVEKAWRRVQTANSDILGGLNLMVEEVDLGSEKGVFYRLQAGPLPSADAGRELCAELKRRNQECLVVRP